MRGLTYKAYRRLLRGCVIEVHVNSHLHPVGFLENLNRSPGPGPPEVIILVVQIHAHSHHAAHGIKAIRYRTESVDLLRWHGLQIHRGCV